MSLTMKPWLLGHLSLLQAWGAGGGMCKEDILKISESIRIMIKQMPKKPSP